MTKQLKQRLIVGGLGFFFLILSIYYSYSPFFKPVFILLNAFIISLALNEYYKLAHHKGFAPLKRFAIGCSIAYILGIALSIHHSFLAELPSLILLFSLLLFFLKAFQKQKNSLVDLAVTVFGIVYLTVPLSCALGINYFFFSNNLQDGRLWLVYFILTTKMTDIGAYFCGKILGRHRLASSISPKKTVEGALGGAIFSILSSCLFAFFATQTKAAFNMTVGQSLLLGLIISILAQLGDLAESLLKRDVGVKDSSDIPGLGGILDIVDSLVFTLPLGYIFLHSLIR